VTSPHVALAALIREARCHAWYSRAQVGTHTTHVRTAIHLELDVCGDAWREFMRLNCANGLWRGYPVYVRVVSGPKTHRGFEALKRWIYRKVLDLTRE